MSSTSLKLRSDAKKTDLIYRTGFDTIIHQIHKESKTHSHPDSKEGGIPLNIWCLGLKKLVY